MTTPFSAAARAAAPPRTSSVVATAALALAFLLSTARLAQAQDAETTTKRLGSFISTVTITGGGGAAYDAEGYDLFMPEPLAPKKKLGTMQIEIFILCRSDGSLELQLQPETIVPKDSCELIDQATTVEVFDAIMEQVAGDAVRNGLVGCPASCSRLDSIVHVVTPSCIERTGIGCATRFAPCNTLSFYERTYGLCCPLDPTDPVVTLISEQCDPCTSGDAPTCESICP